MDCQFFICTVFNFAFQLTSFDQKYPMKKQLPLDKYPPTAFIRRRRVKERSD